jgi:hypothetical protein
MEDPCNPKDSQVATNDTLLLKTQQALLAEMKRQNDLLEEQLRPQREADARRAYLRKERERHLYNRPIIAEITKLREAISFTAQQCAHYQSNPPQYKFTVFYCGKRCAMEVEEEKKFIENNKKMDEERKVRLENMERQIASLRKTLH